MLRCHNKHLVNCDRQKRAVSRGIWCAQLWKFHFLPIVSWSHLLMRKHKYFICLEYNFFPFACTLHFFYNFNFHGNQVDNHISLLIINHRLLGKELVYKMISCCIQFIFIREFLFMFTLEHWGSSHYSSQVSRCVSNLKKVQKGRWYFPLSPYVDILNKIYRLSWTISLTLIYFISTW